MHKLSNTFSWSLSRYNLFNFCERAYYFHYYGAWNGWDKHAEQETIKTFRLKHLITKEIWFKAILKQALSETINANPQKLLSKIFADSCKKILFIDISSLYAAEWENDPKKLCIKELYYQDSTLNEIISWIKEALKIKIKIYQNSKIFEQLSKLPYPAFSDTSQPLCFKLDNIPIWFSPDLIWEHNGKKHFLNLDNSDNWPFKAGLNVLYTESNWKHDIKNTVCHTLFHDNTQVSQTSLPKDNCYSVYGIRSPKEIKSIILASSRKMQSRLTFSHKAYIENFSKTKELNKCKTCKFKELC